MRLTLFALTMTGMLIPSSTEAVEFEFFDKLQPVSHLFVEPACDTSCSNSCSDSGCTSSGCTSCGCRTAPAPTMIGGSLGLPLLHVDGADLQYFANFYSHVAENNSAIPQNRVFFNYKYLNDVPVSKDLASNAPDFDKDISFYELGFEKTLLNDNLSAELLIPFSYLPQSTYPLDLAGPQSSQVELQNIAFGLKAMLWRNESTAVSVGVRVEAPTKEDLVRTGAAVTVPRDVWAVTPYLATLIDINEDLFFRPLPRIECRQMISEPLMMLSIGSRTI